MDRFFERWNGPLDHMLTCPVDVRQQAVVDRCGVELDNVMAYRGKDVRKERSGERRRGNYAALRPKSRAKGVSRQMQG
jgi:hypothetical protein